MSTAILHSRDLPRPPGPRQEPFLGALRAFRRNPAKFLESVAKEHGDFAYLRLGQQDVYLVSDPEAIKEILVTRQAQFKKSRMLERARILLGDGLLTSEGDFHLRQRRLVQPAFHRDRLAGYAVIMAECAARLRARWKPAQRFDLAQEMMRLTLAIVGRALFSADVESEAGEIGAALNHVFEMFEMVLLPFSQWLEKLPLPSMNRFHRGSARLDSTIYRLIAERRASGVDTGDLLSMLLTARDETGESMDDKQVRDEALTLFIAGHETTANALTWAWYLLSQNPEAEARFHAEIDSVLGGRLPGFADLPRLRLTEGVIAEALRLYPPAWAIGRKALQNFSLRGFTIPAGSMILMSPYVLHRDARWFPDPLRFQPERWLEDQSVRPKFAYFPFGGGVRMCIGERFAWSEAILVLATLAQHWRLRLEPGQKVDIKPLITLRTRYGMHMIAEPR